MMDYHYNVVHKKFEARYKLVYSDTDSFFYVIQHEDIYKWIKENPEHFDLSDSLRPNLKDNTNKKVQGKYKDEMNGLIITEVIALTCKTYGFNYQTPGEFNRVQIKKTKGISKIRVNASHYHLKNLKHITKHKMSITRYKLTLRKL